MKSIRLICLISEYLTVIVPYIILSPYLPAESRFLIPFSITVSIYLELKKMVVSPRFLLLAGLASSVYFLKSLTVADFITPCAGLLQAVTAIRVIAEKNYRNRAQIIGLSILNLAAASLFELGGIFLAALLLSLFLSGMLLILSTFIEHCEAFPDKNRQGRAIATISLLIPAAALPLVLILFPILPRTQYPLWNIIPGGRGSAAGLADYLQPGISSNTNENSSAAFRVTMNSIPENRLYFRGNVFNSFDGTKWYRRIKIPSEIITKRESASLQAHYLVSGIKSDNIPVLEYPVSVSGERVIKSNDHVVARGGRRRSNISYSAISGDFSVSRVPDRLLFDRFYTELTNADQLIISKAKELAGAATTTASKVDRIETWFRNNNLSYATSGLASGENPLRKFLFEGGKGNCEYFASAFAIMLRSVNVPCRIAAGYLGGDYNPVGGYYLVRESNAHVWVEAYLDNEGWRRIDPTSFAGGFTRERETRRRSFAAKLSTIFDSFSYWWTQGVVTYDLEKQISLARSGASRVNAENLKLARAGKIIPAGAVLAIIVFILIRRKQSRSQSEYSKLLRQFERIQKKVGITERAEFEGIKDYESRITDENSRAFLKKYAELIYSSEKTDNNKLKELKNLLSEITFNNNQLRKRSLK